MRLRLVAAFLAMTLFVLLVQDLPLVSYINEVESDRIVTGLQRDAFLLAGQSEEALEEPDAPGSTDIVRRVAEGYARTTGSSVVITDDDGVAVAAVGPGLAPGEDFSSRPEVQQALTGTTSQGERYSETLGESLVYVAVPVLGGPRTLGVVRITTAAVDLQQRVNERERGLLLAALITLAISVMVALLLAGNVTRRLRLLEDAIETLAQGDLTARADATSGAKEIKSLAAGFNTMAARLETLVSAQRAFAGDASHQLRTPLTALRLRLDQVAELIHDDPEAAQTRLEAATAEADRLQRLVEGLLSLARSEGAAVTLVRVDVAGIARDRVEAWEPLAAERGVAVQLSAPPSAPALAVTGAVEQILDNYVDNAVEVSPEGSTIRVVVAVDADRVVLRVVDQGPGLPMESRERAFDRFWRGRQDSAGTGLGLAIVAQLAQASRASVSLVEAPGGGIDARAVFATPVTRHRGGDGSRGPTTLQPRRADP